jgi:hypothetical protein
MTHIIYAVMYLKYRLTGFSPYISRLLARTESYPFGRSL